MPLSTMYASSFSRHAMRDASSGCETTPFLFSLRNACFCLSMHSKGTLPNSISVHRLEHMKVSTTPSSLNERASVIAVELEAEAETLHRRDERP